MKPHLLTAGLILCLLSLGASAGAAPNSQEELVREDIQHERTTSYEQQMPAPVSDERVIQFYASDKTAELLYERGSSVLNLDNSRATASFLFSEKRDNALTAAVMFDQNTINVPDFNLSFGATLYAGLLAIENADVVGLAATIEAAYQFPVERLPLRITAGISYAPDILTFGQSDRIVDWNVRAGLPLTDSIDGFVGYRYLQFDTRPGDRELDKRVHFGLRWHLD